MLRSNAREPWVRRRLPPLNSLRAFEAAARNGNLSKAADELFVTHSAVSRHIQKLENYLETRLFERKPHKLLLTRDGAAYALRLKALFDEVEAATKDHFDKRTSRTTLQIRVTPTFASRWLIPRLGVFNIRHPGILVQVNVQTDEVPPDFERSNIDVAVCRGDGNWNGIGACRLFEEVFTPVCSPSLSGPLERVDDLARFPLLHAQHRERDWELWLRSAGATSVDSRSGLQLGTSNLAYQGAALGLGVAMAQMAYVQEDIATSRLALLFDHRIRGQCYFAICQESRMSVPKIRTFFDWLNEEASRFRHQFPADA